MKLPIDPFGFSLALSPPILKVVNELFISTTPPVVLNPRSPPLSSKAYPEFIEIVTFTLEPL